jgi:predicted Ser/Thr protein kinase
MAIREHEALRLVGRYEIVRELGRGATAVVYLARQSDLDRLVALKELAGLHAADPAFIERFLRESRLAGSLNHPNVVTVHEYFEHDGTAFIAMEYLERGSLRPLVGSLTLAQIGGVLEGLLAGLAHAEAHGIVHRDLKPENVMVTSSGTVKIADFGVAKALAGEDSPLTLTGSTVGTPAYMAPEQALAAPVGPAADRYAVGVIAYELLTGDVPYRSDVALALLLRHVNDPVPSPRSVKPDLDAALSAWVERMLAKEPAARPASAAEAWDELDEVVVALLGPRWPRQSRLTYSGAPPAVATAQATGVTELAAGPRTRRRRSWAAGLAAAVVLVALTGGALAARALSDDDPKAPATRPESTSRTTTEASPPPVVHATINGVRFTRSGDDVVATLKASGKPVAAGAVLRRDSDIADGRAWFELAGRRITAATRGADNGVLVVRVRKGRDRVRVDVSAEAGAFSEFRVRRLDGRTVAVTVTRPEVVSSPPQSSPPSTGDEPETTQPQETTPTTPEKPQEPIFKTG